MHAEDPTKVDTPNEDFAKDDHEEENEVSALKSPDPILPDIGMFNSVKASSPLTGRVKFNFDVRKNVLNRRQSLNL